MYVLAASTSCEALAPVCSFRHSARSCTLLSSKQQNYQATCESVVPRANVCANSQALQAATQRIYAHVSEIENKMALLERKK